MVKYKIRFSKLVLQAVTHLALDIPHTTGYPNEMGTKSSYLAVIQVKVEESRGKFVNLVYQLARCHFDFSTMGQIAGKSA